MRNQLYLQQHSSIAFLSQKYQNSMKELHLHQKKSWIETFLRLLHRLLIPQLSLLNPINYLLIPLNAYIGGFII